MRYPLLSAIVLLAGATTLVYASSQSAANLEKEVLDAQHRLTTAQAECSPDMTKLRVPDHTIVDPSGGLTTGDAMRQGDERCQKRKPSEQQDVRVRIYHENVAIITGLQTMYAPDGRALPRRRFTSVWVKNNGEWRHASYQATLIAN
jgi:hypothetical protein